MDRYTSILLPLALARKKRLEEAAEARGESLESFILEAAEAEAQRLGRWLSEKGHSVDHPIYAAIHDAPEMFEGPPKVDERQIEVRRVATELGWHDGAATDWLDDVDRLIDSLETLDGRPAPKRSSPPTERESRRSPRRDVSSVQVVNPVRGSVVDISSSGIGIETRGPFSVPEEIHVSIGPGVAYAKIRAQVRWCVLVRTQRFESGDVVPIYRSGLAFLGH
jgi:hypothetical protein